MQGASVSGTIEFQDVPEHSSGVTVYVRVQDTTRADAKSSIVAERVIPDVSIFPGAKPLSFSVDKIPEDPRARYVVRVHADVDGDKLVSRGDYVSTQSYPLESSVPAILVRRVP
jgi:hypothetical protein